MTTNSPVSTDDRPFAQSSGDDNRQVDDNVGMASNRVIPGHLSARSQKIYGRVRREYGLEREDHALELLRLAMEALDRGDQAREMIARDGLTVNAGKSGLRAHPCVAIERDARLAVARLFRELDLDAGLAYSGAHPPTLR